MLNSFLDETKFCLAKLEFFQILFHILVLLVIVIHVMCSGSKIATGPFLLTVQGPALMQMVWETSMGDVRQCCVHQCRWENEIMPTHCQRHCILAGRRGQLLHCLGLDRFGFFNFSLIQFGFQSQVLGLGFFRFWYSHTTAMQEYPSVRKH